MGEKGRDLEREIEIFGEKLGAGYLTSVSASVLILGKKGRDLEREIELFGEKLGADLERLIKILEIESLSNELQMFNELSSILYKFDSSYY